MVKFLSLEGLKHFWERIKCIGRIGTPTVAYNGIDVSINIPHTAINDDGTAIVENTAVAKFPRATRNMPGVLFHTDFQKFDDAANTVEWQPVFLAKLLVEFQEGSMEVRTYSRNNEKIYYQKDGDNGLFFWGASWGNVIPEEGRLQINAIQHYRDSSNMQVVVVDQPDGMNSPVIRFFDAATGEPATWGLWSIEVSYFPEIFVQDSADLV